MANKVENEKGFLIIEMTLNEADKIGFGIGSGACICVGCNGLCLPKVYYVAAMNETMCEKCLNEFLTSEDTIRYDEDIPYEERNYNRYMELLNLLS